MPIPDTRFLTFLNVRGFVPNPMVAEEKPTQRFIARKYDSSNIGHKISAYFKYNKAGLPIYCFISCDAAHGYRAVSLVGGFKCLALFDDAVKASMVLNSAKNSNFKDRARHMLEGQLPLDFQKNDNNNNSGHSPASSSG